MLQKLASFPQRSQMAQDCRKNILRQWALPGEMLGSLYNLVLEILLRIWTALPQLMPMRVPLQNTVPITSGAHSAEE